MVAGLLIRKAVTWWIPYPEYGARDMDTEYGTLIVLTILSIKYGCNYMMQLPYRSHFSDRRTSSGQYILSVTGPYGPPRYMSGHQISNSAGPNDDNSQYVFFARSPVPHLGSFRAALLLQRDASVSRVRVGHVNQTY